MGFELLEHLKTVSTVSRRYFPTDYNPSTLIPKPVIVTS